MEEQSMCEKMTFAFYKKMAGGGGFNYIYVFVLHRNFQMKN